MSASKVSASGWGVDGPPPVIPLPGGGHPSSGPGGRVGEADSAAHPTQCYQPAGAGPTTAPAVRVVDQHTGTVDADTLLGLREDVALRDERIAELTEHNLELCGRLAEAEAQRDVALSERDIARAVSS